MYITWDVSDTYMPKWGEFDLTKTPLITYEIYN